MRSCKNEGGGFDTHVNLSLKEQVRFDRVKAMISVKHLPCTHPLLDCDRAHNDNTC